MQSPLPLALKPVDFVPHEYSTQGYYDMFHRGPNEGIGHRYTITNEPGYDYRSIMPYPSMMDQAGGKECVVQNVSRRAVCAPPKEANADNVEFLDF